MLHTLRTRKFAILLGGLLVAGLLALLFSSAKFEPAISSVQPGNNSQGVQLRSTIEVNFANNVPQEERGKFQVRLLPGVVMSNVWVSPSLLRAAPQTELLPNTTYNLSVLFEEKEIYTSSFRTLEQYVYSQEELQEISQSALEVSAAFYATVEEFPFAAKMPLQKDNYTVVFDYERNEFRIRLKMPSNAPEETQQEALNAALAEMQLVGIVVEDYGYYVLFSE